MKNLLKLITLALLLGSLIACSSAPKRPENYQLTTSVSSDGSKRFLYSVNTRSNKRKLGDYDRSSPVPYRNLLPVPLKTIEKYMRRELKQTQFCETGYFIYDRRFQGQSFEVLGECNESA